MSFSLKCFGVGDGAPCSDRNHSAFLYRFGGFNLLLDCGEPVTRQVTAAGLASDEIDKIFLSHLHFDHVGGFFMLIQGLWLEGRQKPLTVHLPGYAIAPIRQMLNAGLIFEELFRFSLSFEPWRVGVPLELPDVRVMAFHTTHLESLRRSFEKKYPHPFEAFSFLFETDRRRIGHSADIGAAEDLAPLLERPLNLLVCEVAHVEPEPLFKYLRHYPIERILFIHVGREYWKNLDALEKLAAEMLRGIPFSFARDGDEVALP